MIKPKKHSTSKSVAAENTNVSVQPPVITHTTMDKPVTLEESYEINPMEDALVAIMEILTQNLLKGSDGKIRIRQIGETFPEGLYKPYFQTIQVENGQIDRLIHTRVNTEDVVPLPAIFHHFIDMHWDVGTGTIGACKAIYRMKVVLNNLDIDQYDTQMSMYRVAHSIINCLSLYTPKYSAFTQRFQLDYFDPMETWTKGIQYFWLQYQIHLRDYSTYAYRNYIERHVVCPPFTNHSDQLPENSDFGHADHTERKYDDASKYLYPDPEEDIPIISKQ